MNDFTGAAVGGMLGSVSGPFGFGEDLSSRPYFWLRPDFVPPSPVLIVKDPQSQVSRILVLSLILLMLSFARPGCCFFCRSVHAVITVDQFLAFVGSSFTSGASV